jgi:ankyrin repeat protein
MKRRTAHLIVSCVFAFCSVTGRGADSADKIRTAISKGIVPLQASQKNWYSLQSCHSCHQQVHPQLAYSAARAHGIVIHEEIPRADAAKAFGRLSDLDRAVQYTHQIDPALSDGYLLLAAEASGVRPSLTTAVYARLIANRQRPDGHWDTLDMRPPQSFSTVTATAIGIRAVELYGHASLATDTQARVAKARGWLSVVKPRDTEERVMQMFGLAWTGADRATLEGLAKALKSAQRSDGGWASLDGLSSDAYSTGETLVALAEAGGVPISDAAWKHGIQFLLNSQAADGTWHVVSRLKPPAPVSPKYFETGYPYGHDQYISAMGASWAIRALAASLGGASKAELPELKEAAPVDVAPWAEKAIFGTAADLRAMLQNKLDPNAATRNGTTLLMMVQPDLEKTKLLVDRGAKVNARARSKYDALMVAGQYSSATPTMTYLLDHGAEVKLAKGAGSPLFGASPLFLADMAENPEIFPRLKKAGVALDGKFSIAGTAPMNALAIAVSFADLPTVKGLLDIGVPVDIEDDDGLTGLGWSAIGNQTEVARVLIERGAQVNHVDKKGMTPLLYAASVDFGDSKMVELLLKSGANPAAKTAEGLTAAELVRKYHHAHLAKPLSAGL